MRGTCNPSGADRRQCRPLQGRRLLGYRVSVGFTYGYSWFPASREGAQRIGNERPLARRAFVSALGLAPMLGRRASVGFIFGYTRFSASREGMQRIGNGLILPRRAFVGAHESCPYPARHTAR